MAKIVNTPSVHINHDGTIALVHQATSGTIYAVTFEGAVTMRAVEFLKQYKPLTLTTGDIVTPYPPARAAIKIISNKFKRPDQAELTILKEIIMSQSNIIAVTPSAEFLGRFPDAATAADVVPAGSLLITSVEDMVATFTKAQLVKALSLDKAQSKAATHESAATDLFGIYMTQDVKIAEPEKATSAVKVAKIRERCHKDRLRDLLNAGRILSEQNILDEIYNDDYPVTDYTVRTSINNLKTEKHAGKEGPLKIVSGKVDGVRVYCLDSTEVTFDASGSDTKAAEKEAAKAAKDAEKAAAKEAKDAEKAAAKAAKDAEKQAKADEKAEAKRLSDEAKANDASTPANNEA